MAAWQCPRHEFYFLTKLHDIESIIINLRIEKYFYSRQVIRFRSFSERLIDRFACIAQASSMVRRQFIYSSQHFICTVDLIYSVET